MADELAAQIVAAAGTAHSIMERRKEYRVVRMLFPPLQMDGEPTAFYAAENGSSMHVPLQKLLDAGLRIEREFKIITEDKLRTEVPKLTHVTGGFVRGMIIDKHKETEVEKAVTCFVLSKKK